jgi:hypothetical protein
MQNNVFFYSLSPNFCSIQSRIKYRNWFSFKKELPHDFEKYRVFLKRRFVLGRTLAVWKNLLTNNTCCSTMHATLITADHEPATKDGTFSQDN